MKIINIINVFIKIRRSEVVKAQITLKYTNWLIKFFDNFILELPIE